MNRVPRSYEIFRLSVVFFIYLVRFKVRLSNIYTTMPQEIFQVDAFTNVPFKGNPAAVCILAEPCEAKWMQNVALEMNLAETAFLLQQEEGFSLRWFTPTTEVDLCGHATLASSHILWQTGVLKEHESAKFFTRSGILTAGKNGEWIQLNFPAEREQKIETPVELLFALNIDAVYVGKNRFDYLIEVESEKLVRALRPNFNALEAMDCRGVIVTARSSSSQYDFVSRFFAPAAGINEDPVTGSAHCCLAPYWSQRLGKKDLVGYQASTRGGIVKVGLRDERVLLDGQAVTILRGTLAE